MSSLNQMKVMLELEEDEKMVVELLSNEMAEEVGKIQALVLNTILDLRRENDELKRKLAAEKECKVCEQEMESLDFEIGKYTKAGSGFENLFNNLDSLSLDWETSVKELIDGMAELPIENSDPKKKVAFQEKTSDEQDLVDFEVKIKEKLRFTPRKEKAARSKTESKEEVKEIEEHDAFNRVIEKIRKKTEEGTVPLEDEKDNSSNETFSGSLEKLDGVVSRMMVEDQNGTPSSCFCGIKIGRVVELRNHIERTHFTSLAISCNLCSQVVRSRKILRVHVARVHGHEFEPKVTSTEDKAKSTENLNVVVEDFSKGNLNVVEDFQEQINESETFYDDFVNNENFVFFCDQCDHRTDCDESLNNHKQEEHGPRSERGKISATDKSKAEGDKKARMEWKCKDCSYKNAAKKNLRKHYRNMHYKITDVTIEDFNKIIKDKF